MPATNRKNTRADECLPLMAKVIRHVGNASDATLLRVSFLGLAVLLSSIGCAPPSSTGDGQQNSAAAAATDFPEITDELLREEINDAYVRGVPAENGAGEPIGWSFDDEEPKEFTVVERQLDGERATVIIDIKTQSAPNSRSPRYLAGQIRTKWELQTGWALRTWEIVETENISLKYKNLPKPPAQNSNR